MLETLIWFTLRDDRVPLKWARDNAFYVLLGQGGFSVLMSLIFFSSLNSFRVARISETGWIIAKFFLEFAIAFTIIPFLAIKAHKSTHLDPQSMKFNCSLGVYLQSKL